MFNQPLFKMLLKSVDPLVFAIDHDLNKFVSQGDEILGGQHSVKQPFIEKAARLGILNGKLLHAKKRVFSTSANSK